MKIMSCCGNYPMACYCDPFTGEKVKKCCGKTWANCFCSDKKRVPLEDYSNSKNASFWVKR